MKTCEGGEKNEGLGKRCVVEIQCDERATEESVKEIVGGGETMCVYYRYKDTEIFPERSAVWLR